MQQLVEDPRPDRIMRFLVLAVVMHGELEPATMHCALKLASPNRREELDVTGWPALIAKLLT